MKIHRFVTSLLFPTYIFPLQQHEYSFLLLSDFDGWNNDRLALKENLFSMIEIDFLEDEEMLNFLEVLSSLMNCLDEFSRFLPNFSIIFDSFLALHERENSILGLDIGVEAGGSRSSRCASEITDDFENVSISSEINDEESEEREKSGEKSDSEVDNASYSLVFPDETTTPNLEETSKEWYDSFYIPHSNSGGGLQQQQHHPAMYEEEKEQRMAAQLKRPSGTNPFQQQLRYQPQLQQLPIDKDDSTTGDTTAVHSDEWQLNHCSVSASTVSSCSQEEIHNSSWYIMPDSHDNDNEFPISSQRNKKRSKKVARNILSSESFDPATPSTAISCFSPLTAGHPVTSSSSSAVTSFPTPVGFRPCDSTLWNEQLLNELNGNGNG
jgi:hypothetical protein